MKIHGTSKTYLLFWLLIPIILLIGFASNAVLDIPLHDVYFVISSFHVALLFAMFAFVSGIGYFIFRDQKLNRVLTKIHVWFSIPSIFLIGLLTLVSRLARIKSLKGKFIEYENIELYTHINFLLAIGLILLPIGFVAYLINIGIAVVIGFKRNSRQLKTN